MQATRGYAVPERFGVFAWRADEKCSLPRRIERKPGPAGDTCLESSIAIHPGQNASYFSHDAQSAPAPGAAPSPCCHVQRKESPPHRDRDLKHRSIICGNPPTHAHTHSNTCNLAHAHTSGITVSTHSARAPAQPPLRQQRSVSAASIADQHVSQSHPNPFQVTPRIVRVIQPFL